MLENRDYCDYETCVALREIGCRIETEWYIHQPSYERGSCYLCFSILQETSVLDECDYIPRLSLYEAQKWLREEKKLHITIYSQSQESWQYRITKPHQRLEDGLHGEDFSSFEEALLEGVKCAVKILKDGIGE